MKIRKTRILQLTTAALLTAAVYSTSADTIVLDPDGSGNSPTLNNVNTLQFGAGNSLLQGAIPFTVKNTFQLLLQAQLDSIVTNTGQQITPIGLNATSAVGAVAPFEVTMVGSVTASITQVNTDNPPRVAYRVAGTQAANSFVEIYYDGAQNANPLPGTGYNDGTLILRGFPSKTATSGGIFALTQPQPTASPPYDLFSTNNYSGVTSVTGEAATRLDVEVTFLNPAFFVAPGQGDPGRQLKVGDIVSLYINHSTPFDLIDPSHLFDGTPNTSTGAPGASPSVAPHVGANNGTVGPDLQMQSMVSASFKPGLNTSPTPTPSTTPTPTATPSGTPTPTPSVTPTPSPGAPKVIVSSNQVSVKEGNDAIITFTFRGPATHGAITVNYTTGGTATLNTDYTLSGTPGQVVIGANAATATITLHAIADTVTETNGEVAKIIVAAGSGYIVPTQPDARRVNVTITE